MMKPELKERWIAALEGPYADKKGEGKLCSNGLYCCLGVIAEIEGNLSKDSYSNLHWFKDSSWGGVDKFYDHILPDYTYGLSNDIQERLAEINDHSETFAPVIEYIRENL